MEERKQDFTIKNEVTRIVNLLSRFTVVISPQLFFLINIIHILKKPFSLYLFIVHGTMLHGVMSQVYIVH